MVKQQYLTGDQNAYLNKKMSEDDNSKMIWAIDQIDFDEYNFEFNLYDAIIEICEIYDFDLSNFDADDVLEHLENTIQTQIQNSMRK